MVTWGGRGGRLKEEEDKEVAYPESESEVLLREAESAIQTIRDDKSKHEV